jgi:hypothetical protein
MWMTAAEDSAQFVFEVARSPELPLAGDSTTWLTDTNPLVGRDSGVLDDGRGAPPRDRAGLLDHRRPLATPPG